jgi:c-di-GMP-binding flagellar brake protein YcgR
MGIDYERRRVPRVEAGWQARYAVDDRPDDGWYGCRVLDVSLGGVGLELFGPAPPKDALIRVEMSVPDRVLRLHVRARARYVGSSTNTGIRVGVEWHEVTPGQSAMLNSLLAQVFLRAS